MRNANKTVTVYRKEWDPETATDRYHGRVLEGVSFFSRILTTPSTEGLTAASEGILRVPAEVWPQGLQLKCGDLVCQGALPTEGQTPGELDGLCPYVFTVVGTTDNKSVLGPHVKVVCK